ncbi:hypothetical protein ACMHY2_000230 [Escherichia coli]
MSIGSEMNNDVGEKVSDLTKSKKCDIKLAAAPSDLLSKEGFALYIGKRSFSGGVYVLLSARWIR